MEFKHGIGDSVLRQIGVEKVYLPINHRIIQRTLKVALHIRAVDDFIIHAAKEFHYELLAVS